MTFLQQSMVLEAPSNMPPLSGVIRPLVLAVDDDDDNLLLMANSLELFGYSYISASDGQTALDLAKHYQPDLILLDICLPDLDGIEVIDSLKQDPQMKRIPVIAVTALASTCDRARLLAAGCVDYVTKPFMLDDLEASLSRHLMVMPSLC